MPRVKRGVQARARHKKVLKQAKGYYGARSRVYRVTFQAVTKKLVNTHTVTVALRNVNSVNYGLHVSTQHLVKMVYLTAVSSTVLRKHLSRIDRKILGHRSIRQSSIYCLVEKAKAAL